MDWLVPPLPLPPWHLPPQDGHGLHVIHHRKYMVPPTLLPIHEDVCDAMHKMTCAVQWCPRLAGLAPRPIAAVHVGGSYLAVLVTLPGHDNGGHCVLHKQDIVRGQRQRKRQPAWLHAAAAMELQICTAAASVKPESIGSPQHLSRRKSIPSSILEETASALQ